VAASVVAALLLLFAAAAPSHAQKALEWSVEPVTVVTAKGRFPFRAEIADKPELRARGLMFRQHMDEDQAMLFDFGEEQPVAMWMKNTFIPLDMLFIDASGTVINVARWTTPQSLEAIESADLALAVLELNAGTADRLKIRAGDRVEHRIFQSE
jgi:uncharacterized membrane protein (UPF0127 family)